MEEKTNNKISVRKVIKHTKEKKSLILKVLTITFLVSCFLILPVPRYYTCKVSLAPELENVGSNNKLSSIASSLGFDVGTPLSVDAISPTIYPNLMTSNDFILNLIHIKVKTSDNSINTDYYTYLKDHQKETFYVKPFMWIASSLSSLFTSKKKENTRQKILDPFILNKEQTSIFGKIKNNIKCDIDIKTNIITISVKDQDPLVAATIADSTRTKLQNFITKYRTSKARNDLNYYKKLTAKAKEIYEHSRQLYGSYADANYNVILQSYKSKEEDLENDMQLKFNTYSALNNQLQAAEAKVQEHTPAFTVIQSATVPVSPNEPKRMAFILTMLLLSFIITISYINRDLLLPT